MSFRVASRTVVLRGSPDDHLAKRRDLPVERIAGPAAISASILSVGGPVRGRAVVARSGGFRILEARRHDTALQKEVEEHGETPYSEKLFRADRRMPRSSRKSFDLFNRRL